MREFIPAPHAIKSQAAIDVAAPPASVAALYCAVEKWGGTFPATIEKAQVIHRGDNWEQIEISHKHEGRVPNTLIFLSATEVGLEESKKRFNAKFLRVLRPFLTAYVQRQTLNQMKNYVLAPLKTAAGKAYLA